MASDYQEVLQWLLNVGLLPEGHHDNSQSLEEEFLIVPYPYQVIKSFYEAQRMKLADEWMGEAKYLFIDAFIEHECKVEKLREVWGGNYPPRSIQALLRTLLVPEISIQSKHVIFVYLFMDVTNVLKDGAYSSIVRNLIKFPAVFKMNPAMIKRTQAFWNLDNGNLDTAVEELISPLSHDKHIPLWQRELLIGALLKQNANSLALRSLRCPGNQISPDLEMFALLANNLMSEALKVQRASGDRKLLVKLFEKILHSPNYEQLLDLSLTEEEGLVLREYLQSLKDTGLPNHLNIHFVFLLQRSKFLDAALLVESMNDSNMNMEPPKQVLNAYYATMESTTRKLTSMVYSDDSQVKESPLPLSVNLIQARCNAKNDIYQKCVQSINEAAYENSQDNQSLPFIGSPRLGIFEYRQTPLNLHDVSYALEINEHGKRKQGNKSEDFIRLEDLQAPQQKKRKLNEQVKRKSYVDMKINNLTVFKETKPNYSFTRKSPGSSIRTTPERVKTFGNFLNTPVIEKKTPPTKICPPTPHSILKTRSRCGSISPAPSRFSEFNDDNKSVKSITFAALPDSRDTSLNDSSMLEENFHEEEKLESSAENFYSPGKSPEVKSSIEKVQSFLEGPKARKSIKSRSTTPDEEENKLNESVNSEASEDLAKPFRDGSVLKDSETDNDSDEASDSSVPDKSIYNYVRRSVLPANFCEFSDSSDDEKKEEKPAESSEDSVKDEHFEEEELPEHSDYSESSGDNEKEFEYGELELDDSDESSSESKEKTNNEVICLDSSSDEDVQEPLPKFNALGNVPTSPPDEEMFSIIYDDKIEIESPPYEQLSPGTAPQSMLTRQEIEAGPGTFNLINSSQETVPMTQEDEDELEKEEEEAGDVLEIDEDEPEVVQDVQEIDEDEPEVVQDEPEVVQDEPEVVLELLEVGEEEPEVVQKPEVSHEQPEVAQEKPEVSQNVSSSSLAEEFEFRSPEVINESAASEECSFVSASGGEMNEAVVMADFTVESIEVTTTEDVAVEPEEASKEDKEASSQGDFSELNSQEVTNVLDQAQIDDDEISMETAQENVTIELLEEKSFREMRGRSVPSSGSSSPRSRSTRASTEDREKPRNLRKTKTLEKIQEIDSPVPSPGRLTRSRSHLQIAEDAENTPQTPTRMTRRRSQLIEDDKVTPPTPNTRRMTRAASKESVAESEKTPDEPGQLTRQRSLRNRTISEKSENDDAKSTRSTRSTRKKSKTPSSSTKVTPEKASPVEAAEAASLTNRRLTRQQMQVLEKSRQLTERIALGGALRPTRSEDLSVLQEIDSDNESVKSDSGSVASSRASRKRKVPKRFNSSQEETSSVTSKSSRRSLSPNGKKHQLSVIPEESTIDESSQANSSKRTKKTKK